MLPPSLGGTLRSASPVRDRPLPTTTRVVPTGGGGGCSIIGAVGQVEVTDTDAMIIGSMSRSIPSPYSTSAVQITANLVVIGGEDPAWVTVNPLPNDDLGHSTISLLDQVEAEGYFTGSITWVEHTEPVGGLVRVAAQIDTAAPVAMIRAWMSYVLSECPGPVQHIQRSV